MMRAGLAPMASAAAMYSCCLRATTWPRTRRAMGIQPTVEYAMMMVIMPGSSTIISRMTIIRYGMPLMISSRRIMMMSSVPPK